MSASSTSIRFPVSRPSLGPRERDYLLQTLDAEQLSQGALVKQFEEEFASWIGTKDAVATMNGTVALHLALAAYGIGPGDAVLVPDLTFVATANAVRYTGAQVILCDVELDTWCLSPKEVMKKGRYIKAVVPVHLYGHFADIARIESSIDYLMEGGETSTTIRLIEDAAEAHGATMSGAYKAGAMGHSGIFSFYGNKILTCGEGGMVVSDDPNFLAICRVLRGQGMIPSRRYYHSTLGYNYRMTELQAAIGCAQVEDADAHVQARRSIAGWYHQCLKDLPLTWQVPIEGSEPSYWLPTCLVPEKVSRDAVMQHLLDQGIETRPTFVPLHQLPMYKGRDEDFPVATEIGRRGMSLPSYRGLTKRDVEEICDALRKVVR